MVANQHQRALLVIQIDAARRVGQEDGTNSHAAEDAHGEGDLLRRVTFIKMHASLHHGDGDRTRFADHHLSSVADRGRAREGRDLRERDAGRVGERIGETAEAGT